MSLILEQNSFAGDVSKLIQFIQKAGWVLSFGETWRPPEMQKIYFDQGKSKTMKNSHGDRLAVDLNFFKPVTFELTYAKKDLQQFGDYWESLDKKNIWGGNWKTIIDTPHFERRIT